MSFSFKSIAFGRRSPSPPTPKKVKLPAIKMAEPDISELLDFARCCDLVSKVVKGRFAESVKYTGFDPVATRAKLLKVADYNNTDMARCSYLFLCRGTNLTKMKGMMSQEGITTIDILIGKYALVSKVKGAGKDAVNLARVTACFPVTALTNLSIFPEEDMPRPVKVSEFEAYSDVPFPRILMSNVIASLVPTHQAQGLTQNSIEIVLALICCYCALETRHINADMKKKSLSELYKLSEGFVMAAHSSKITPEKERWGIIKKNAFQGVLSHDGVLEPNMERLMEDLRDHFK